MMILALLCKFCFTTFCAVCFLFSEKSNGYPITNLKINKNRISHNNNNNNNNNKHIISSLSIKPYINDTNEEKSNRPNIFQRLTKNMVLPSRKVIATAGIFSTSVLPMYQIKKVQASSMSSMMTQRQPMKIDRERENTLMRKRTDSPVTSSNFVRNAVQQVGPSVVRIDCDREIPPFLQLLNPEAFKDGDTIKVSGSGIVVSSDGYLLTNSHVIQQARSVTITLSNGRSFRAAVVGFDELTDLAVLKADIDFTNSLPKAPLGDSSTLQSGDWVIAVGCPVGLDFTVTLGIVSSPKRSANEVGAVNLRGTYIQTDAALNSGNSGGPLVDATGQVVGINTMVRSNTEAIGFAIPINRAKQIYEILKQGKKPNHAYFGIDVMTLTPDFARIHNEDPNVQRLPEVHGALVMRVAPNSPAAVSGFRKNDIIVEINGNACSNSEDADMRLDACKPGDFARIKVVRGEVSKGFELNSNPLDLLAVVEERRMREQLMGAMKPPPPPPQRR